MSPSRGVFRGALRLAPRGLSLFLPLAALLLAAAGCSRSGPIEQRYVALQDKQLWRAGAETWAPDEYRAWHAGVKGANDALIEIEGRLPLLRDYKEVTARLRELQARGDEIALLVRERREGRRGEVAARLGDQRERIERLGALSSLISVGQSYRESQARRHLAKAGILVCEAESLVTRGQLDEADRRLAGAEDDLEIAKRNILEGLSRFTDQNLVRTWRTRVAETIRESKVRGTYAIVVSKVDRRLVLYKAGRAVRTWEVALGSGSIQDKVCAGDRATPEGRYRVVKKIPRSKYNKALLINYPNADDVREFEQAKRRGEIPARAGIGGLIEIHGGGREGMTLGCVALEDRHMDELYALVEAGTPVTIVGATDVENAVARAIRDL